MNDRVICLFFERVTAFAWGMSAGRAMAHGDYLWAAFALVLCAVFTLGYAREITQRS